MDWFSCSEAVKVQNATASSPDSAKGCPGRSNAEEERLGDYRASLRGPAPIAPEANFNTSPSSIADIVRRSPLAPAGVLGEKGGPPGRAGPGGLSCFASVPQLPENGTEVMLR